MLAVQEKYRHGLQSLRETPFVSGVRGLLTHMRGAVKWGKQRTYVVTSAPQVAQRFITTTSCWQSSRMATTGTLQADKGAGDKQPGVGFKVQ